MSETGPNSHSKGSSEVTPKSGDLVNQAAGLQSHRYTPSPFND